MNRLNRGYDIVNTTLASWLYLRGEMKGKETEEFCTFWMDRFMALLKTRKEYKDIIDAIRYQRNTEGKE